MVDFAGGRGYPARHRVHAHQLCQALVPASGGKIFLGYRSDIHHRLTVLGSLFQGLVDAVGKLVSRLLSRLGHQRMPGLVTQHTSQQIHAIRLLGPLEYIRADIDRACARIVVPAFVRPV